MIGDHVLVLAGTAIAIETWMVWVRMTATRFSLPLFMIVSGYLLARRGLSAKRVLEVVLVALLLNFALIYTEVGFAAPDILAVWLLVLPLYPLIKRFPIEIAALGILQMLNWRITWEYWHGYQPGQVVAFLALGSLLSRHPGGALLRVGDYVPSWCAVVGRRPLLWYGGHFLILVVAGLMVSHWTR
jgi:hypothetical protein